MFLYDLVSFHPALLERVFLRAGSAETDQQLEAVLDKFLCPVLLKIQSADEAVRKKVSDLNHFLFFVLDSVIFAAVLAVRT